jgi:hypothetical protein
MLLSFILLPFAIKSIPVILNENRDSLDRLASVGIDTYWSVKHSYLDNNDVYIKPFTDTASVKIWWASDYGIYHRVFTSTNYDICVKSGFQRCTFEKNCFTGAAAFGDISCEGLDPNLTYYSVWGVSDELGEFINAHVVGRIFRTYGL